MKKISALIIFLLASLFSLSLPSSISAVWTKYTGNPVLGPGPSGSWDDQSVSGPSVVLEGSTYKMWYDGTGASNGITTSRIGYATSSDGINWIKNPSNPVLDIDPTSGEQNISEPAVIFDDTEQVYKYKMWFTSHEPTLQIKYATSTDGILWIRYNLPILQSTANSWDERGVMAPTVLKIDNQYNQYNMWYSGTNGSTWKIGYADSPNGTSWTKSGNNPLISPTASWEYNNVANPSVISNGINFLMWYHTGSGTPINIAYSFSTGPTATWEKPSSENPSLTLGLTGTFDSEYILMPCVIRHNNFYKMWYVGKKSGDSHWRIGYASTEEVTPTTTPIPTGTPTLVPTSMPTPTGPKKVVFAPGIGSSWNADAILNCKTDGYKGSWTLAPFATGTYTPLLSALGENGKPFYYDWRTDVGSQSAVLRDFINNLGGGEKVNFVGHSLGGLVGRAYLENQGDDSKLEKLLTVGSPHQGTPQAYPAWSAGEIWEENLTTRIATTILLRRCAVRREEPRETLRRIAPSTQNLLPIFDYLRDTKTKLLKPVTKMNAQNNWLTTGFPFYGVEVGTLSGKGFPTLKIIRVNERNKRDTQLGNWADGKPSGKENTKEGDGSVLLSSAQLPNADNRVIHQNHGGLVASSEGIDEILDFLGIGGATLMVSQATPAEPRSALIIIGYPSGFWVMDTAGKLIKDKEGMVSINNPGKGHYKFGLIPKSDKTLFIVAQFLEDGRTLWKEYNLKNRLPKFGKINFDPGNPQEDTLQ